jgi:hypothetical protein
VLGGNIAEGEVHPAGEEVLDVGRQRHLLAPIHPLHAMEELVLVGVSSKHDERSVIEPVLLDHAAVPPRELEQRPLSERDGAHGPRLEVAVGPHPGLVGLLAVL